MRPTTLLSGFIIFFLLISCIDQQSENTKTSYQWNWSSNWEKEQINWVILTDHVQLKKYDVAKEKLNWFLKENPKLNPSLYINGRIIYENLIEDCDDPEIKSELISEEKRMKELMMKNFPFFDNGS